MSATIPQILELVLEGFVAGTLLGVSLFSLLDGRRESRRRRR